jgi:hypothetical protein
MAMSSYAEYADLPPLELVKDSNFDISSVSGRGLVTLKLAMPLKPGITSADFDVSAEAKLVNGRIRNAIEGVDLESATIDFSLQDTVIAGKGKAKLGDKQASISWRRPLTKSANADEDLTLSASLTDRDRQSSASVSTPTWSARRRLKYPWFAVAVRSCRPR